MHLVFFLTHVTFLLFFALVLWVSIPLHILVAYLRQNKMAIDRQTEMIRVSSEVSRCYDSEDIETVSEAKSQARNDNGRNIIIGLATALVIYFAVSSSSKLDDSSLNFLCGYTQSGLLDPKAYKLDLVVNHDWSEATLTDLQNKKTERFSVNDSDLGYIFSGDMIYREEGKTDELRYEKRYVFKRMTTPKRWNAYYYANYDTDPVVLYACREE